MNMNWLEFLQTKEEDLLFMKSELSHIKSLIDWVVLEENAEREIGDLKKRTDLLINHCETLGSTTVDQLFSNDMEKFSIENRSQSYMIREAEIDSLMREISFLSLAIEQRLKGLEISQSTYFFPTQSLSSEFPGLHRAAGCVLSDFFDLINGENWSIKPTEPLPLVIFGEGGYRVHTKIRVAFIPISDKDRLRFWVGLGHEAFHEKVGTLIENASIALEKKTSPNEKLQRILQCEPESQYEFIKNTVDDMMNDISGIYSASKPYSETIDRIASERFRLQVEEIFCDVGATILSGPAHFLSSSSQWAPGYKSAYSGFTRHVADFSHPPGYVRLKYILQVLKELDYPLEDIELWGHRVEELRCEDEILAIKSGDEYQINQAENVRIVYEKYSRLICEYYLDKIARILTFIIAEPSFYTGKKWKLLKDDYGKYSEDGSIQTKSNSIDLMNIAWLKRLDVYEKVGKNGGVIAFSEWHKRERKLYENAICFLSNRFSEKINKIEGTE